MGKQRKKVDFQKVKLKVGRHIRKGTNITDPKFKARKIVLQEQLKQYAGHPDGKKKLLPTDIIKGLDHSNVSRRAYFLEKAKEFFHSKSSEVLIHVASFLRKACALVIDREPYVREGALSLVHAIFKLLSVGQMTPFYPLLRSYVNCAATHIDSAIRNDSLRFLDLVLEFFPCSLCDSCVVFSNFLDLISYRGEKGPKTLHGRRQLIATPSEKITAQEWRVRVFQRLIKFLDANIHMLKPEEDNSSVPDVEFDHEQYSMAIKRHFDLKIENMLTFSLNKVEMLGDDICSTNTRFIEDFTGEIVQLLFDTWKEAVPYSPLGEDFDETQSQEAPMVMMTVLKVMCRLAKWLNLLSDKIQPEELYLSFREEYSQQMQVHFLTKFPFSIPPYRKSSKTDSTPLQNPVSGFEINLEVSKVFALLVVGTSSCVATYRSNVLEYLFKVIKRNKNNLKQFTAVVEVIKLFLLNEESFNNCLPHQHTLFTLYQNLVDEKARKSIRNLFMSLILDLNFRMFIDTPVIQMWLKWIPEDFINMVEEKVIDKDYFSQIKKIACRGYPAFINGVESKYSMIIEVLQEPDKDVQDLAVALITRMSNFTLDVFHRLALTIHNSAVSVRSVRSIMFELIHRVKHERHKGFSLTDFTSFLLNVCLGMSANEEDHWISKESEMFKAMLKYIPNNLTMYKVIPSREWSRHKDIHSITLSILHQLPKRESVNACVQSFLQLFLSNTSHAPLHTVAAILDLYTNFIPTDNINLDFEQQIADLTLSFYVYEMTLATLPIETELRAQYSLYSKLIQARKNIYHIMIVISNYVSALHDLDTANLIGTILLHLADTMNLSHRELNILKALIHSFNKFLGKDILSEPWYKKIVMSLSSVC